MSRLVLLSMLLIQPLLCTGRWQWQDLPALPQALGGVFAGVVDNQLIVAGGSYWRGAPWIPGSEKIFVDTIYALAPGAKQWRSVGHLPAPSGYGASIVKDNALWLIGGQDLKGAQSSILRITSAGQVTTVGHLKDPLMMTATARLNGQFYLLGGQPNLKTCLRSANLTEWQACPAWPGPGRFFSQATQLNGALYLAGGADLKDGQRIFLADAYRLLDGQWSALPSLPVPLQAGFAATSGRSLLILSGSDGALAPFEAELGTDHPGFSPIIWSFDGKRWAPIGRMPYAPVTSTLVEWQGALVIPGGEDRPAHRSSRVLSGKLVHE